jgi:hypothetical protein
MQVSRLRLRFLRPTLAPSELLFQKAKSFFDLLALPVNLFDLRQSQLKRVGHHKLLTIFDQQNLMTNST